MLLSSSPVQSSPVHSSPVQFTTSHQSRSAQFSPVQYTPAQSSSQLHTSPVQPSSVQSSAVQPSPVHSTPVQSSSAESSPFQSNPVQSTLVQPSCPLPPAGVDQGWSDRASYPTIDVFRAIRRNSAVPPPCPVQTATPKARRGIWQTASGHENLPSPQPLPTPGGLSMATRACWSEKANLKSRGTSTPREHQTFRSGHDIERRR